MKDENAGYGRGMGFCLGVCNMLGCVFEAGILVLVLEFLLFAIWILGLDFWLAF